MFLKALKETQNHPVFVHCLHGSDRTGVMCAVYRIFFEGWTKNEAIREMTEGGYGFHPIWKNLIAFVNDIDMDRLRNQAGLTPDEKDHL